MRSSIHRKHPAGNPAERPKTSHEYVCDVECIHPELVDQLEDSSIDWETASRLSEIFQVMSDPTRLRIISLLAQHELCVCDIAAALNMTQSAISHQLRVLRMAGLVKFRKEGRIAWYSLDDDHVEKLFEQGVGHIGHVSGNMPETDSGTTSG
ncbi:MAG: helix-turn-helix transcriptional regulator [Actinobacteria bacterium]|nr:helix-turn-helix transcriptional regulator [Actinomycetota bacterium]